MKKQLFISYCDSFASRIDEMLRPDALERINFHRSQQHCLVIISASLEDWIKPWAVAQGGFSFVIGTQIAFDKDDRITGKFSSKNCYGKEKVVRLKEKIGAITDKTVFAYGDSRGDKELLSLAHYSFYRKFTD